MFKIGIIGNGFVGKATQLLNCEQIETVVYDIRPEACSPLGTTLNDLEYCDLIFICVPSPMNHNGDCYVKIIEDVVNEIKNPFKIIRSTVPVGFCESINCFFMPEFLTEANWVQDFINSKYWVFGCLTGNDVEHLNFEFKRRIKTLFNTCYSAGKIKSKELIFVTTREAETLKIFKNVFLAIKVGVMNEFFDYCSVKGVDFGRVSSMMKLDERIVDLVERVFQKILLA